MVSTEKRFKAVQALIDAGEYFTINRARQYGKTTMLDMIWRRLKDQYLIIDCSFEGVDDTAYESHAAFAKMFCTSGDRKAGFSGNGRSAGELLEKLWRC
jgi:hypothetical protein